MDPWQAAHRSVLDHVLGLIAESSWADLLVLRGSALVSSWTGSAARLPGDLDWVVLASSLTRPDDLAPWPFVDTVDPAQHWPEAVHGAGAYEMWTFEDFDTGGQRPRLPPEGLHWMTDEEIVESGYSAEFITDLVKDSPVTPEGVEFDLAAIDEHMSCDYDDFDSDYSDYGSTRSIRTRIWLPWSTPGGEHGKFHLDFAFDEVLPEPPVLTVVPRAGGHGSLGLFTATREASLAWKLRWLAIDQENQRQSDAKDLYDAVLLAELPGLRLSPGLLEIAMSGSDVPISAATLPTWFIDGDLPGGPELWLARLAAALPGLAP